MEVSFFENKVRQKKNETRARKRNLKWGDNNTKAVPPTMPEDLPETSQSRRAETPTFP